MVHASKAVPKVTSHISLAVTNVKALGSEGLACLTTRSLSLASMAATCRELRNIYKMNE